MSITDRRVSLLDAIKTNVRSLTGTALRQGDRSMTYVELWDAVEKVTAQLRKIGDEHRTVLVEGERSMETIVNAMAVMNSGRVLVLGDTTWAPEYRRQIIDRIGVSVSVSCRRGESDVVSMESARGSVTGEELTGLAYIITTSGTTGEPKLVGVRVDALASFAHAIVDRYGLRQTDTVLQSTATSFDVWHEEVWPTLVAGACLEVSSRPLNSLPFSLFTDLIADAGVTVINVSSSYFAGWMTSLTRPIVMRDLRLVVVGSEVLPPASATRFVDLLGAKARLINAYGLTEATVTSLTHEVRQREVGEIPIGTPLKDVSVAVVDEIGDPVADGTVGELCIGGERVISRYLGDGNPCSKFLAGPVWANGQGHWLRTGDFVKRQDGVLYFCGRNDDQVKINGKRVELDGVQRMLLQADSVTDARVLVVDGLLTAFVVGDGTLSQRGLDSWMRSRLPDFMLPASYVFMDALPLLNSGKVDRELLETRTNAGGTLKGKRFDVEALWMDVLGVPSVSAADNFFERGGSSIAAAKFIARARRELGLEVDILDLFAHPTLVEFQACAGLTTPTEP